MNKVMPIVVMYLIGSDLAMYAVADARFKWELPSKYLLPALAVAAILWLPIFVAGIALFFVYIAVFPLLIVADALYRNLNE